MIPEKVTSAVASLVASGQFGREEEAYEAFLEAWQELRFKSHELALIEEGLNSGPALDGETVMAELRRKFGGAE